MQHLSVLLLRNLSDFAFIKSVIINKQIHLNEADVKLKMKEVVYRQKLNNGPLGYGFVTRLSAAPSVSVWPYDTSHFRGEGGRGGWGGWPRSTSVAALICYASGREPQMTGRRWGGITRGHCFFPHLRVVVTGVLTSSSSTRTNNPAWWPGRRLEIQNKI